MRKFVLLVAVCIAGGVYAQEKKRYTNFEDTVFTMKDVIVKSEQVKKTQALRLDVPVKFMPQSTHVLPTKLLEERGIQNIQDAARFIPGIRVRSTYGAFQEFAIRGFSSSVIALDGVRDERSTITSYPVPDLSMVESIELVKGPSSVLCGSSAVGGMLIGTLALLFLVPALFIVFQYLQEKFKPIQSSQKEADWTIQAELEQLDTKTTND